MTRHEIGDWDECPYCGAPYDEDAITSSGEVRCPCCREIFEVDEDDEDCDDDDDGDEDGEGGWL